MVCLYCVSWRSAEPCLTPKKSKKKIFLSKTNVFNGRRSNLARNNKPSVARKSGVNKKIWCGEFGPKTHVLRHWNTVCQLDFTTSYLLVTTTFASNWWRIIAYKVTSTSAEHICFRWKYFFLGLFGSPTLLRSTGCVVTLCGAMLDSQKVQEKNISVENKCVQPT